MVPRNPQKPVTTAGARILEHLARGGALRLEVVRYVQSGKNRDGGHYNYRAIGATGSKLSRTYRRVLVEDLQAKGLLTPDPQEPRLTEWGREVHEKTDVNGCWLEGKAS